jgi:hypothetical protein
MWNGLFTIGLGIFLVVLFLWAFRKLPGKDKQFLAALPMDVEDNGAWTGRNLTYYGFFIALGGVLGAALLITLLASISVDLSDGAILMALMFALCIPSSRIIARVVEKKKNTFTVGGASFLGIAATPLAIWLMNSYLGPDYGFYLPIAPTLAAFAIAYALGEGLGRLGCISYGCCYGKPFEGCGPWTRKILSGWEVVFHGGTKKVSYAGGLEGEELVPVQAMTSVVLSSSALVGTFLFLNGLYIYAFLCCMIVSQGWRAFSETLRADYRGEGRISSYQYMAMIGLALSIVIIYLAPRELIAPPDILSGLRALWDPAIILLLQAMGVIMFLYFGLSTVTMSSLTFSVLREKV